MKTKYFNLAKKLSYKSDYLAHQLGAVIVRGNELIGIGFNKRKTHPLSKTRFNNIHAELSAIINSGEENLNGATIYVYRETKDGELAASRPCVHCLQLLRNVNIRKVYYTTPFGYAEETI